LRHYGRSAPRLTRVMRRRERHTPTRGRPQLSTTRSFFSSVLKSRKRRRNECESGFRSRFGLLDRGDFLAHDAPEVPFESEAVLSQRLLHRFIRSGRLLEEKPAGGAAEQLAQAVEMPERCDASRLVTLY